MKYRMLFLTHIKLTRSASTAIYKARHGAFPGSVGGISGRAGRPPIGIYLRRKRRRGRQGRTLPKVVVAGEAAPCPNAPRGVGRGRARACGSVGSSGGVRSSWRPERRTNALVSLFSSLFVNACHYVVVLFWKF